MKAVMIVYNQVMQRELMDLLDELEVRGFTRFDEVRGRGTTDGEPHMGTHTWPSLNGAVICVVEDEKVASLLDEVEQLDEGPKDRGIRAFVWDIEQSY